MVKSIPALINPALLKWVREDAGYTLDAAAQKVRLPVEKLLAWETGKSCPTIRQAEMLAKFYHRPYSVLGLSTPPPSPPLAAEHRRLLGVKPGNETPELRFAIRELIHRRKVALRLIDELGGRIPDFTFSAHLHEETKPIAAALRENLGISIKMQKEWPNEFHAWHAWRTAVEKLGVLVFQFYKVAPDEVRGVGILDFPLPVIGVNNKDVPASKPFTLLHELVHLMLAHGNEEKPALMENRSDQDWMKVERFAEAVTGEVLVPSQAILEDSEVARRSPDTYWDIFELRRLARRYKVTPKAMITRLLMLGACSPAVYKQWQATWEKYLHEHPPREEGGFATPAQKAFNRNGRSFTELVLEALTMERITSVQASHYLELGYPHIEKLRLNLSMAREFDFVAENSGG